MFLVSIAYEIHIVEYIGNGGYSSISVDCMAVNRV